jgi:hypothetical protein
MMPATSFSGETTPSENGARAIACRHANKDGGNTEKK